MPNRIDEVASKAMGAIKVGKAAIEGLSGVFRVLAKEHGELTALMMHVKSSSDVAVRRDLFPKIRSELLAHEKGELREVYPVFEQHPDLERFAVDHAAEVTALERALEGLGAMAYEDAGWGAEFDKLMALVSRHVKEEENEYFPAASRILGDEETGRMKISYEKAKAEAAQQLS